MKTFHQQNLHSSKKAGDCKSADIDRNCLMNVDARLLLPGTAHQIT